MIDRAGWLSILAATTLVPSSACAEDRCEVAPQETPANLHLADGTPRYRLLLKVYNQSGVPHSDAKFQGWLRESEKNTNIIFSPCGVEARFDVIENNAEVEILGKAPGKDYFEYSIKGEIRKLEAETSGDERHGFINVFVVARLPSDNLGKTFPGASTSAAWVAIDYDESGPEIHPGGNVAHEIGHLTNLCHPHDDMGMWKSPYWPHDNFMASGDFATLPNRHISTSSENGLDDQCAAIRAHAIDLGRRDTRTPTGSELTDASELVLADGSARYRLLLLVRNQSGEPADSARVAGWLRASERTANQVLAPCGINAELLLTEQNAAVDILDRAEGEDHYRYSIGGETRRLVAETSGDGRRGLVNVYLVRGFADASVMRTFPHASSSAAWVKLQYEAERPEIHPGGSVVQAVGFLAGLRRPHDDDGIWVSAAQPRDNFMASGNVATLPNTQINVSAANGLDDQCAPLRGYAIDLRAHR